MTVDNIYEGIMRRAAETAGVEIDESTLPKVARARLLMNVDMQHCPCAVNDEGRGCVGPVCMKEMLDGEPDKYGRKYCHCHCFFLTENEDLV